MYDAVQAYQQQATNTANPAQLVLMLYDGALAALERAGLGDGVEGVHRELVKAQDIITELLSTLDVERGGEIAHSLRGLYEFCLDRLVEANLSKDLGHLDAVTETLRPIRDAWEQSCIVGSVEPVPVA